MESERTVQREVACYRGVRVGVKGFRVFVQRSLLLLRRDGKHGKYCCFRRGIVDQDALSSDRSIAHVV